jgi:hypothetical protein
MPLHGMGRYYLIATLIVVVLGSIAFAHRLATLREFDVTARATGTPTPTRGSGETPGVPFGDFSGEGPWVLSALPSCFVQQQSVRGTAAQLAHEIPPARLRVAPGTTLRRGNCVVTVREHDILVVRGADRLHVPAEARLYDAPKGLTLVYEHNGRTQIRVYSGEEPRT